MVKGIGVDVVDIKRFREVDNIHDLIDQIFTEREKLSILPDKTNETHLAKIFAVKEATMKALGVGLHYGSYWKNIEVSDGLDIRLSGYLKEISDNLRVSKIFNSITRTRNYMAAIILLEG
jgi:holo-[acyl-carrier protein] synthase